MTKSLAHWIDLAGRSRPTPRTKDRLRPHQIRLHARLRDFVFARDNCTCQRCRTRYAPFTVDHVVSLRNGGTNHPSNLQTLCKDCNDAKSNTDDRAMTWIVRRRPFLSAGPFRTYRVGLTQDEASALADCHNRAFPEYQHMAAHR